jgi:hypothetical protein
MNECTDNNLWDRTACILSYSGSATDCVINYTLLTISVAGCWVQLRRLQQTNHERITMEDQQPYSISTAPTSKSALISFGFTVAFQVGLCLGIECSGISIVWCAAAGWMLMGAQRERRLNSRVYYLLLPLTCDAAGIIYYAVTAEAITTVAHGCALTMGAVLYWLSTRNSATTPSNDEQVRA